MCFNDEFEVIATHQNIHVEGFAIVFLVLFFDLFHVNFRATHHDAGQNVFTCPLSLKMSKASQELLAAKYWLYQSLAVCTCGTFIDALSFSAKNAGLLPAHFTIWREEKS